MSFSNKIMIIFIILINKLHIILNNYIAIPFKLYNCKEKYAERIFIDNFLVNNKYFPIEISKPPQKIIATINSMEYELVLKKRIQKDFEDINSNYFPSNSTSFSITSKEAEEYENSYSNASFLSLVKDSLKLCTDYNIGEKKCKNFQEFNDINFIYYEHDITGRNNNNKKLSYLEIGLNFFSHITFDTSDYSLFHNLIKYQITDNQNWFIYFFLKTNGKIDNNNDDGIIVFGGTPTNFLNDEYSKDNIISCEGNNKGYDYSNYWSLIFDSIKLKSISSNNEYTIGRKIQGTFNLNFNVIVGNKNYYNFINNNFFSEYLITGTCRRKSSTEEKFYYYICDTKILKDIENKFPKLSFIHKELEYVFEFTYKDLFVEIGEQLFFLVVFYIKNPTSSFILGNIFLQKYLLSFDNNSKKIFFYKDADKYTNFNVENSNDNYGKILWTLFFISIFIAIFIAIGIYIGRNYLKKKTIAKKVYYELRQYGNDSKKDNFVDNTEYNNTYSARKF